MANGPGKYDVQCTLVRENTKAMGVVLIVFNGIRGTGFEVQAPLAVQHDLPAILEHVARSIREDLAGLPREVVNDEAQAKAGDR